MKEEHIALLAGAAVLAGLILHHRLTQGDVLDGGALDPGGVMPLGPYPAPLPVTPAGPGVVAPPPVAPPAPPPLTAAQIAQGNADFNEDMAAGRQWQRDEFGRGVEDLKARVASGEVAVGSPQYVSTMDYLANLRGGVATKAEGFADLATAGLGSGRRGRARLRLV